MHFLLEVSFVLSLSLAPTLSHMHTHACTHLFQLSPRRSNFEWTFEETRDESRTAMLTEPISDHLSKEPTTSISPLSGNLFINRRFLPTHPRMTNHMLVNLLWWLDWGALGKKGSLKLKICQAYENFGAKFIIFLVTNIKTQNLIIIWKKFSGWQTLSGSKENPLANAVHGNSGKNIPIKMSKKCSGPIPSSFHRATVH